MAAGIAVANPTPALDNPVATGATISRASCAALVACAASGLNCPIISSIYEPTNGTPFIALAALAGNSPTWLIISSAIDVL